MPLTNSPLLPPKSPGLPVPCITLLSNYRTQKETKMLPLTHRATRPASPTFLRILELGLLLVLTAWWRLADSEMASWSAYARWQLHPSPQPPQDRKNTAVIRLTGPSQPMTDGTQTLCCHINALQGQTSWALLPEIAVRSRRHFSCLMLHVCFVPITCTLSNFF